MSDQFITLQLEIPSQIDQLEVWKLEAQLRQIAGVTIELWEPRGPVSEILLFIQVAGPYVVGAVAVAGGINTLHELAQHIHDFVHPEKSEADQKPGRHKVAIITKEGKKGKRIELYDLSLEEIEKLLK